MATPHSTPSVARLIVVVSRSLELYQSGDLPGALRVLDGLNADPLPDRPEWIADELERRSTAALRGGPIVPAALDWIELARDRIRRELGEEILGAVTPVPLALRSALSCLGAE